MKLLTFIFYLQICSGYVVRRGEPEQLVPAKAANPIGLFLSTLTDLESIMNRAAPVLGPFLKSPATVSSLAGAILSRTKLAGYTELKPKLRANAKRKMFRYGPFKMYGQGVSVSMN
jgi:hypothetical protein